ncbi:hypothetical protein [Candidatus Thalassolituus haligoni]|uniref:hypothetical protein n=1 Tax=Candidatus Thalassolituus haligoni TaxID=3100113 RepID=UPI0035197315
MSNKSKVDELFNAMSDEVCKFIKSSESGFSESWVSATYIKEQLDLKKPAYPQGNKIDNKTGWIFATIARHLQDQNKVLFKKVGSRSF